jgi:hypothetical protein
MLVPDVQGITFPLLIYVGSSECKLRLSNFLRWSVLLRFVLEGLDKHVM